jgi:hypothetical protein
MTWLNWPDPLCEDNWVLLLALLNLQTVIVLWL